MTTSFRSGWGEQIRAEHEPLRHESRLRHLFRCFDTERQEIALKDAVIGGLVRDVARTAESKPVLIFGNTISHLAPMFYRVLGAQLRLLHLHRDPVANAASTYVRTRPEWWRLRSFEVDPYGLRISPFDPHARFVEYRDRWVELSLFEMILYQWLERHAYALEVRERWPEIPFLSMRSEDVFQDPDRAIQTLAQFAGLSSSAPPAPTRPRRNATWDRTRELRPLGDAWRACESHPAVLELAAALGHPYDPQGLEPQMERYQLPPGLLPWIRHRTKYWELRGRAARRLRELGIVPPPTESARGLPPRPLGAALREAILRRRS